MKRVFEIFTIGLVSLAFGCSDQPAAGLNDAGQADTGGTLDATEPPDSGGGGALSLRGLTLPDAHAGMPYSARIEATGGTAPYTYQLSGGSALPDGLTLSTDGYITGTPAHGGAAGFVVEVTDSASPPASATGQFIIKVIPSSGEVLVVTTELLPMGMVGAAYTGKAEATGGAMPYVWSLASGALPDGVILAADGTFSGTPVNAGSASFIIQVTDASQAMQTAIRNLTITVSPAQGTALAITTTSLSDGTVGAVYAEQLAASGGAPPYSWSLASGTALPSGLVLAADGSISGTPVQAGQTTFSVQVLDSGTPAQAATAQFSITIAPSATGTALSITTAALADGTVGQLYSGTVTATGGATPYTFAVSSGALPPGISLAGDGTLDGTPAQAGTFSFSVQCTDSSAPPQIASRSLSITVASGMAGQPLVITTSVLADGQVGQMYTAQLTAAGGTPPYDWSLDPLSTLPPGLALSTTGELSGTPLTAGRFAFSVIAADASMPPQTASAALTLTIAPEAGATLAITTASLPAAIVAVPYMAQLAATGGAPPYAWSIATGTLPSGLTLDASGLIAGTTTISGSFGFTVEVGDSSMPQETAQATFMLTVATPPDALRITTSNLPRAQVGRGYHAQIIAAGGIPPYSFAIAMGALPPGLTFTSTGAIFGVATSAGVFPFSVQVTDNAAPSASAQRALAMVAFANPGSGLAILNSSLPQGREGRPYNAHIAVSGGTRPYVYAISSGALPGGVMLDGMTGQLSGTPAAAGDYTFAVRATDSSMPQLSTERTYTLTIRPPARRLRVVTRMLPAATLGMTYTATLAAVGGSPPYSWSIASGMLPMGLTLTSTTGVISGTPSQRGRAMFTAEVTDTMTATATRRLDLTVR